MIMLKFVVACSLGAARSSLGTLGFAQDASPPHQSVRPVHNGTNTNKPGMTSTT
jgi:hypothetical protein